MILLVLLLGVLAAILLTLARIRSSLERAAPGASAATTQGRELADLPASNLPEPRSSERADAGLPEARSLYTSTVEEDEAAAARAATPETGSGDGGPAPEAAPDAVVELVPEPEPEPVAHIQPEPAAHTERTPEPAFAAEPEPAPEPAAEIEPEPAPEPTSETEPAPEPSAEPAAAADTGAAIPDAAESEAAEEPGQQEQVATAASSEEPFEHDGRWYFRRGDELLLYDETTGQWVPAPHDLDAETPAPEPEPVAAATGPDAGYGSDEPEPVAAEEPPPEAGGYWRCGSCGAVNGSTATSCRMCFAARP